ncbi:MAG: hypothetical protein NTX66_03255 [Candidatus Falkowbacteria bacterium]|nr:hypothetical protein [Candidatus Falkowbacteria bacterium]
MIRKIIGKLKISKKQASLLLVIILGSFLLAHFSYATWVTEVLGWLAAAIVWAMGKILILLMQVLIYIAQYNNFIRSDAVANGWVIVRDLCNMFFVVILLVISFATILHIENYNYKKWLPKLVMMAILINFSKTICGLIIDFGQVVMLTFVNAFKDIGGGNLTSMLGITEWQSMQNNQNTISEWEVVAAYFLAVIYVIISVIVITTMIAMLIMRMIMLWVYIVLSPAAYLLAAFPGGQKYSSQWWSEFTKNVIVGPVLCFFIWLSFVTITPGKSGAGVLGMTDIDPNKGAIGGSTSNTTAQGFGTSDLMVKFIISIGMLIGGLKIAQEIGGAAGSMAGKGMAAVNKGAAIGMGGVAAVTGYRYASGVLSKYSSEKKARREEKYSMRASQLTAFDARVRGNVKGSIKGVKNVVKGRVKDLSTAFKSGYRGVSDEEVTRQQQAKAKKKIDRKENKRYDEKAKYDAYHNKEYIDKNGVKYKEHALADGTVKYRNEETGEFAKDRNEKEVTKMSDIKARFKDGLESGLTRSRALKNQLVDAKRGKEQKLLEDSGASISDLMRVMKDTSSTDHVAGRKDVSLAKNAIGNNPLLLKKFDEAVNKRFAHLNFNLDDKGGQGKFKKAMDNGQVDGYGLDSSAYNNANLQTTMEDYSGIDFADNMSRVAQKSKQHRNNVNQGLELAKNQSLDSGDKMITDDGELNKYAKLSARIGGNQLEAFRELDGTFNEAAAAKYNEGVKANHLVSFDAKQLIPKEDGSNKADIEKLERAMANMQISTLTSLAKTEQNPELLRRIMGILKKQENLGSLDAHEKVEEIKDNNVLQGIYKKAIDSAVS